MIIAFNGDHGSGKSTIAKMVASELNYPRYYIGQIFRDMAKEKGMDLPEFRKACDTSPDFDKEIDFYPVKLAEKLNDFVLESRTAWHFIPQSFKIYLKVDDREGAKRIYKELHANEYRKEEGSGLDSIEDVMASEEKRKQEDDIRYKKYYNLDIRQEKNYDLVVDTKKLTKDEVFNEVMRAIRLKLDA